ncbi:MAG: ice-binding family protein [Patescibacteria group bacterium]
MKIFNKIALFALALVLMSGLTGSLLAFAAASPSFGYAATYAILASTYTNTSAATTITGDIGFTTGPAQAPLGTQINYGSGVPYATAGTDQGSALAGLAAESCTFSFAAGAIDLSTDVTHGTVGVYTPGVYCITGAMDIGGTLNLNGNGTYIFRSSGALTSTVGAIVSLSGASACDVFWTPSQATTLAANTTFVGTIIDDAGITVGANTSWSGRALAFGGTITTGDTSLITAPSCSSGGSSSATGTITVTKIVINDDGGTKLVADFPLFVSGTPVISGVTNTFSGGSRYAVHETMDPAYAQTFSGDCDSDGWFNLGEGQNLSCTITNDDIEAELDPPLIDDVDDVVDEIPVPDEELILTEEPEEEPESVDTPVIVSVPTDPVSTVTVPSVPGLPVTGFAPMDWGHLVNLIATGIACVSLLFYVTQKKDRI